jgi:hypothetical protein
VNEKRRARPVFSGDEEAGVRNTDADDETGSADLYDVFSLSAV